MRPSISHQFLGGIRNDSYAAEIKGLVGQLASKYDGFVDVVVSTNTSEVRGSVAFRHRGIVYTANYTSTLVVIVPNDVQDKNFQVNPEVVTKTFIDLGLNFDFYDM